MQFEKYDYKKHDPILAIPKDEIDKDSKDFKFGAVCIDDGKVIAATQIESYDSFYAMSIYVDPNYRNRNIGSMLILFTENLLKDLGYRDIFAIIKEENKASSNLFIHLGYNVMYVNEEYDVCIYVKNLIIRRPKDDSNIRQDSTTELLYRGACG